MIPWTGNMTPHLVGENYGSGCDIHMIGTKRLLWPARVSRNTWGTITQLISPLRGHNMGPLIPTCLKLWLVTTLFESTLLALSNPSLRVRPATVDQSWGLCMGLAGPWAPLRRTERLYAGISSARTLTFVPLIIDYG